LWQGNTGATMSTTYNPEKLAEAEEALRMSIVSLAGVLTEKHLLDIYELVAIFKKYERTFGDFGPLGFPHKNVEKVFNRIKDNACTITLD
jgi:hypothetical protein